MSNNEQRAEERAYNARLDLVRQMLHEIGEKPERPGLLETPKRIVDMWKELFAGYQKNPKDLIKIFPCERCDEIIIVKDIIFHSMCEHHMMPFFGVAHVAYIPNPEIGVIGISKLARLVEMYARRLQIQERLGIQVVAILEEFLKPLGAACVISATHTCMTARGINKPGSITITSALTGVFKNKPEARAELMSMIQL